MQHNLFCEVSISDLFTQLSNSTWGVTRGARQVGKSFVVRKFGAENFKNIVEVNFEFRPELKSIFENYQPDKIIQSLSLILACDIVPGETLLFLDEIQECPKAIISLRYFFETMPELHVIAAGSLLEFYLNSEEIKVPVGRVEYLFLRPMSFGEFLDATGHGQLREFVRKIKLSTKVEESVHKTLIELLRTYLIIGGMPSAVSDYCFDRKSVRYQVTQSMLLQTYRDDFGKYANLVKHKYLEKVFLVAPSIIANRFSYVSIDREIPYRELKNALELLLKAGVLKKAISTSGHDFPIAVNANENKFKLIFLDVGLAQRSLGLDSRLLSDSDWIAVNAGAIAEQLVGQEIVAYGNYYEDTQLYFWARDKKGSCAEVDYLIQHDADLIPIEVKSVSIGRLKSLKLFMQEHSSRLGVRVSSLPLSFSENILSLPAYALERMKDLINECKQEVSAGK